MLLPDRRGPANPGRLAETTGRDHRVYVFGDVHGRADLLDQLKDAINDDLRTFAGANALVIGLGDYIDRGPDSKGVVDLLGSGAFDCDVLCLRGNHEQMLLDFLADPARCGPIWFRFGALETLRSYRVDVSAAAATPAERYRIIRDNLAAKINASHIEWLQQLPLSYETDTHFFAHAGARPGTPLARQAARDLLWIRKGFADRDRGFEKIVVHGHTPVEKPYFGKYRINLDTGAYFTDRLSCLVIEKFGTRFLNSYANNVFIT
jgi:serine/threonine protein phosphatase 1